LCFTYYKHLDAADKYSLNLEEFKNDGGFEWAKEIIYLPYFAPLGGKGGYYIVNIK
jgi:hypothetical protein